MLKRRTAVAPLAMFLFCVTISSDAAADPFQVGDFITYSQDSWGTLHTAASDLLDDQFDLQYPGGVEIGIIGPPGNSALFTNSTAVLVYLPADGLPGPLQNDLQDPVTTSAGAFGGNVLALQLSVDFNDAGLLAGSAGIPFGDLILFDLPFPDVNGLPVRDFLAAANTCLGGGSCLLPLEENGADGAMVLTTLSLALSFEGGTPSQFAQDHLALPAQPPQPVPEPATLGLLGIGITAATMRRFKRRG